MKNSSSKPPTPNSDASPADRDRTNTNQAVFIGTSSEIETTMRPDTNRPNRTLGESHSRLFRVLVVPLFFAALAGSAWAIDEVVLIPKSTIKAPGGRLRGTIQSESPTEIQIQVGGTTQNVPLDQVASVRYDGQPATLTLAENRESSNNLTEAAELYAKAGDEASSKPFVAQTARMGRARVLAELGMGDAGILKQAIRELTTFTQANPKSRHIITALELLARLDLQQPDPSTAAKPIADLEKVPGGADRAATLKALLQIKKGEFDEAIKTLDPILAKAAKGSPLRRDAMLVKAQALAGQKKFQEAEAAVREVIKDAPAEDAATRAPAYNTLGDCLHAAGNNKEAIVAYLYTDLIYSKNKVEHPRAMAQIAKMWHALGRDDRAQEAIDHLKQEYPQSPWVADAQAALGK
jgi:tetratricopeptide (TPR) repeat protein